MSINHKFCFCSLLIVIISLLSCTKEVTEVTLNKAEITMNVGESVTLKATVSPSDATDPEIVWKSSNPLIAWVDNGTVRSLAGGETIITATAANGVSATCKVTVIVPIESVEFNRRALDLGEGETKNLEVIILPEEATNKALNWKSSNEAIVSVNKGNIKAISVGQATISATSDNGCRATIEVFVNKVINGHCYVDLGLSVKWAVVNVGAESRAEYGNYYSWGETATKRDYGWNNYKYCIEEPFEKLKFTKYIFNELNRYNNNLDDEDDVVSALWGCGWRMPTFNEFQELEQHCSFSWGNICGKDGLIITSKVKGYENNSIFLPVGGKIIGNANWSLWNDGFYWTKSLEGTFNGRCIWFYKDHIDFDYYSNRCEGLAVRGVIE